MRAHFPAPANLADAVRAAIELIECGRVFDGVCLLRRQVACRPSVGWGKPPPNKSQVLPPLDLPPSAA